MVWNFKGSPLRGEGDLRKMNTREKKKKAYNTLHPMEVEGGTKRGAYSGKKPYP